MGKIHDHAHAPALPNDLVSDVGQAVILRIRHAGTNLIAQRPAQAEHPHPQPHEQPQHADIALDDVAALHREHSRGLSRLLRGIYVLRAQRLHKLPLVRRQHPVKAIHRVQPHVDHGAVFLRVGRKRRKGHQGNPAAFHFIQGDVLALVGQSRLRVFNLQ